MSQAEEAALENYPHGRGYGHDYMRGGEVFGGYGYAQRDEYEKPRGELMSEGSIQASSLDAPTESTDEDSEIRT